MNRRDFLRFTAAAGAASLSWRLWASPSGGSNVRFLVVFLRGGYDCLGAVAPYTESFYYESRPNIALARPSDKSVDSLIPLDNRWGLNPALDDYLRPYFDAGQLAFIPFAGTNFVSRSHFQAQDWIEFGQPPIARPQNDSGFLNRLLVELGGDSRSGISFTSTLPPVFRGSVSVANVELEQRINHHNITLGHEDLVRSMYVGHPLETIVDEGLSLHREVERELGKEMLAASRNASSVDSFVLEASRLGRLLREQPSYSVGFLDVGGWDTHIAQGGFHGTLSSRLQTFSAGLNELEKSMGPVWDNTVLVVMSEFGRTFRENGNRGTDHGHGTTYWVLGGKVSGGIRGEQGSLGPGDLHQDRDIPVLNDYRETLGGIIQRIYGMDSAKLARIFPKSFGKDLGLV